MSRSQSQPAAPGWAATHTGAAILDVLGYAHSAQTIGVIYGGAGLGKTSAAQYYASGAANVFIVSMAPDTASVAAAMDECCHALGMHGPIPSAAKMRRAILEKLADRDALLIVDEAQHLSVSGLESFRAIYDSGGLALVFMGNESVYSRLTGGSRAAHFAQLFSRVGVQLPLTRAVKADVEALAAAWGVTGKAEIALLWKIAQTHGALRLMVQALGLARRQANAAGADMKLEHLQGAWQRLGGER